MRQISVNGKPLRGLHRRLRSIERWAASFEGNFYPREENYRYSKWKIPVHELLVEGDQARIEVQAFCVQQLLEAAAHISRAADRSEGYYRVACLLTWPWLYESEVTIFYDQDYYLGFLSNANALAPQRISDKLALHVPPHFIEHGRNVVHPENNVTVQWWCIGEPA